MKINNKKIEIITKYFYPVTAGIETNIIETYSVLAKKGWSVTAHTSSDTLTEKNILPLKETVRNISIIRYPYKWYGYIPKIDWNKTDLVCLHNFNIFPHSLLLFYSLLRSVFGKKSYGLIAIPHGGFNPEWSLFSLPARCIKITYHKTLGKLLLNFASDKIRVVSEWEKEEMIKNKINKDKITVITNGLEKEAYEDVEKFASEDIKKKLESYGKYILQIGRIYKIKNYETTIKALTKIDPSVNYVIAGPVEDDEYMKNLKRLIEELQLTERVYFAGTVQKVDKYYLMKKSLAMVHMAYWESFCNVVNEGMSQGSICIVSNKTALPFLIKDGINGYCLPVNDNESLADRVNFILNNITQSEIKNIQENNKKSSRANSWAQVAHKVDKLYREVIN